MFGIKLHGKSRIRVGDTTTHGGVVVTGSSTLTEDGIPIARKGDKVTCPRCEPHIFVIAEGLENCLDRGIPIAVEGHLTTCGAKLIASSAAPVGIHTASATSETSEEIARTLKEQKDKVYKIQFRAVDAETGNPVAKRAYTVIWADGKRQSGVTDAEGKTPILEKEKPETIRIRIHFIAPAKTLKYEEVAVTLPDMSGLKQDDFETKVDLVEAKKADKAEVRDIHIRDRAATRQAIIIKLRNMGIRFTTQSEWKAIRPKDEPSQDWNQHSIVIHHAGNSYSCSADGVAQLRKIETMHFDKFKQVGYHYAIDCNGTIYEALDIRYKGAHLDKANTGAIGIVFITDFSDPGEAWEHGPGNPGEFLEILRDAFSEEPSPPPAVQINAAMALVRVLIDYFQIQKLGGHREFAARLGDKRSCPGRIGLEIVDAMRKKFGISTP